MALAFAVSTLSSRAAQNLASDTTECLPSCANQYRNLPGIVLSCLTTIFLCIWVALHLNVPEPVDTQGMGYLDCFKIWMRSSIRNTIAPVFVTLVFPEWVLGMAFLQFTKATELAQRIRELQNGNTNVTRKHGFFIIMGGFHLFKQRQSLSSSIPREGNAKKDRFLDKEASVELGYGQCNQASSDKNSLVEEFGTPLHPLDEFDVVRLLKHHKIHLPTPAELDDKCKSNGLAKFLVIIQTLWFIAQCISRKAGKMPLTELEVITLGYTLLTVAMYIAWWDKPYRVNFPVRVYEKPLERTAEQIRLKRDREQTDFWGMALAYCMGVQGERTDLRSLKQVPMFHSGYNEGEWNVSDSCGTLITVIAGMVFGAAHFLAWSSPFPSNYMRFLWQFATIVMTAVPPAAAIVMFFGVLIGEVLSNILGFITLSSILLLPPLYFAGRCITIVLALVTLATLPLDAYRDVEWSNFFPHI